MTAPTPVLRALQQLLGPPLRRWLRVEVVGAERVPPGGPLLLAPNHRSFLDHFLLVAVAPRPVRFLGKQELARGPLGRLYRLLGMVPVRRGVADREALEAVQRLLEAGEAVVLFPEGTRSRTGQLFRFRSGVARLAQATGAAVVPVGLRGTAEVWPLGRRVPVGRPPSGTVQVAFGDAMAPPGATAAQRRAFTEALWLHVAALCGQERADRFAVVEPSADAGEGERR